MGPEHPSDLSRSCTALRAGESCLGNDSASRKVQAKKGKNHKRGRTLAWTVKRDIWRDNEIG